MEKKKLLKFIEDRTVEICGVPIIHSAGLIGFINEHCIDVINEYEMEIFDESGLIFKKM